MSDKKLKRRLSLTKNIHFQYVTFFLSIFFVIFLIYVVAQLYNVSHDTINPHSLSDLDLVVVLVNAEEISVGDVIMMQHILISQGYDPSFEDALEELLSLMLIVTEAQYHNLEGISYEDVLLYLDSTMSEKDLLEIENLGLSMSHLIRLSQNLYLFDIFIHEFYEFTQVDDMFVYQFYIDFKDELFYGEHIPEFEEIKVELSDYVQNRVKEEELAVLLRDLYDRAIIVYST